MKNENLTTQMLVARNHSDCEIEFENTEKKTCGFCSNETQCLEADEVINHKYFTDYDVYTNTGYVCIYCAYCMSKNDLKRGNWLVTQRHFKKIKTNDLRCVIENIMEDEYEEPFGLHIAKSAIRCEHGYHFTPLNRSNTIVNIGYSKNIVNLNLKKLIRLIDYVEKLRSNDYKIDEIRKLSPNINKIKSVGMEEWYESKKVLKKEKNNIIFDLALKTSTSD